MDATQLSFTDYLTAPKPHTRHRKTDPQTSRLAARSVADAIPHTHQMVLAFVRAHPEGVIQEQATLALCAQHGIRESRIRSCFTELEAAGLLYRTGEKGRTTTGRPAEVWAENLFSAT